MRQYFFETFGTMILVIMFGLTSDPLALGLVLATLIYGGMFVSGAHFNPAVSFAYFLKKDISFRVFVGFSISQILGAFAASGILLMITDKVFYLEPPTSSTAPQKIIIELLLTFLLVYAYLNLINNKAGEKNRMNALGIGLTLVATILIGKNISGACLNPALSIGTSIVDYFAVKGNSAVHISLYTIAPISGAALATLFNWFTTE